MNRSKENQIEDYIRSRSEGICVPELKAISVPELNRTEGHIRSRNEGYIRSRSEGHIRDVIELKDISVPEVYYTRSVSPSDA